MTVRGQRWEGRSQRCRAVALWSLSIWLALDSVAQEELPRLLPPHGELPPTFWDQSGTMVMVSVILVLLILALVVWWLLRPKPIVDQPPEIQARTALEELSSRPEDGVVLSRVSQILRRYILAAFELPSGEPTTAEFCRLIANEDKIGLELSAALASFLRQCDDRKFALANPTPPIGAVTRALELIARSESRRAPLRQTATVQAAQPAGASA
jgi:hypothetical protein